MAWTDIADFVLNDPFGKQSANKIKDNIIYVQETVLGNPADNSGNVVLATGTTTISGGVVTISGGKLHCTHADGLEVDNDAQIDGDLTVDGEIEGSRCVFCYGWEDAAIGAVDSYVGIGDFNPTNNFCYPAHRAGSVVGAGVQIWHHSGGTSYTITPRARVNTSNALSLSSLTISANGYYTRYGSQARNTVTFSAGDIVGFFIDVTSAGGNQSSGVAFVEVVFDT